MTIQTDGKPTKEVYGEFQAIRLRYKRLIKNPRKRVKSAVTTAISYTCALTIITILYALYSYYTYDTVLAICTAILAIFDFLYILFLTALLKQRKAFINDNTKKLITVDEDGICLDNNEQKVTVKWESIMYIIVNKYTVCTLPDKQLSLMLGISTDYKDDLLKAIEEYGHKDLIVDNSDLYK